MMKELVVTADLENLEQVMEFIEQELEPYVADPKLLMHIALAVEEIFTNISSYAYQPEIGEAVIRCHATDGEITLRFEDFGKQYNPLEAPEPDLSSSASERRVGGLGVYLTKTLMDSMEYRHENGKNILVIKKRGCQAEAETEARP